MHRIVLAVNLWPIVETTLLIVLVLLAATLLAVTGRRLAGRPLQRRREARLGAARPILLGVLADDEPGATGVQLLAGLDSRTWRTLEPSLVAMLGKVRGESRDRLAAVLTERGTVRRAAGRARSWSSVRRCRAGEMLGTAAGPDAVGHLAPLLRDRNLEVRTVAARALGRIGVVDAVEPLLAAASGPRPLSAREVAAALVVLEPAATARMVAVARRAGHPAVRSVTAEVLGLRGAYEATGMLEHWLQHDSAVEVRIRAARALGRIGAPTSARPLEAALESSSGELRTVVARAIGQLGSVGSVSRLVGCLSDPAHRVAGNAAAALASLGEPGLAALRTVADGPLVREAAYAREALAMHAVGSVVRDRSVAAADGH